ncbi:Glutamine transport system permease protein GlnP [Paenibacillus plantiphilus]|uniref:Glutamine transport system permease protein GlnP n=1 Tax=Paenibacillus plantiphilus TaxID=2905650 RepID=A0ABM9BZG1_9BACL|nr:amino acid ABC transporter permease [Paenibacillus plantiphilus]CAH1198810.1 Glutamine transport system permease protein GlnP [Paenibacillus plantiphilus]
MSFDFGYIIDTLPLLLTGLKMTLFISVFSILFSLIIGMGGAVIRTLKIPVLSQLVVVYVDLIRNTPLLVHVFFLYFGLPAFGIKLSAVAVGIIALSLWGGAFAAENFRGGTDAVPHALIESGQSLGLSTWQIVSHVIIPLGFRISFPAFSNTAVSVIKNSAYMTSIGVAELTFMAVDRMAYDFKTYEMLLTIAVIYLILIWGTSYLFGRIERKLDFNNKTKKGSGLNGSVIKKFGLSSRRTD